MKRHLTGSDCVTTWYATNRYRDLAFFPHTVVPVSLSVSKEHVQWSEDNLTIWVESLLIPPANAPFPVSVPGIPKKKRRRRGEVPPLINSIRHGLLRVRAPILCYAFWRALSIGAHPLRAGPVCDTGLLRGQNSFKQPGHGPLVPYHRSWDPFTDEDPIRANQASIIRFTNASLLPLPARASFVARCSSWIPDSGTQDPAFCQCSHFLSLSLSLSIPISLSVCFYLFSSRTNDDEIARSSC